FFIPRIRACRIPAEPPEKFLNRPQARLATLFLVEAPQKTFTTWNIPFFNVFFHHCLWMANACGCDGTFDGFLPHFVTAKSGRPPQIQRALQVECRPCPLHGDETLF